MKYEEAKAFVSEFLRGDNSGAIVTSIHFKMAIMEVSTLCVPSKLKENYDDTKTDVFRMLHEEEIESNEFEMITVQPYIKNPIIPDTIVETDELPIDQQLALAVVFYICSYFSNKYTDRYEAKAKKTISVYVSNTIT